MVTVSIAEQHRLRDQWIAAQARKDLALQKKRDAIKQEQVMATKRRSSDTIDCDSRKSRKVSIDIKANLPPEKEPPEKEETEQEREDRRDAKRLRLYLQIEALKCEYARCYPRCIMPNYHLPWCFIEDLERGETRKRHGADVPRISVDGKKEDGTKNWNKTWCDKLETYVERSVDTNA
jgi:hypothetical protein